MALFTRSDIISGPVLLATLEDKGIYIIGEDHCKDGNTNKDTTYILDKLWAYAAAHPLTLLVEANKATLEVYRAAANERPSPLKRFAATLLSQPASLMSKPHLQIRFVDICHDEPFNSLESVYAFESYAKSHVQGGENFAHDYFVAYKRAKQLEKELFSKALRTRKTCEAFFLSLIDPDMQTPSWFEKYAGKTNVVKHMVHQMRAHMPSFTIGFREMLKAMLDRVIMNNQYFSAAMAKAEKTMRTKSQNFVADKHVLFQAYMTALNSVAMDFYTMGSLFKEARASTGPIVFLGGVEHCLTLLRHLPKASMKYVYSSDAVLRLSNISDGMPPMRFAPTPPNLLRDWI